ncbi:hypothetical protein QR680_014425 [Steinernema hermaphroditum]|uniref:Uncharacterized protein n=1 Tax=Steinernema hermaphroditum TaxID=289476 RepID=A0AA39IAF9_9BILA|nr:hypothetical protein QR680_014425 [Steinernema hermaphroditum]
MQGEEPRTPSSDITPPPAQRRTVPHNQSLSVSEILDDIGKKYMELTTYVDRQLPHDGHVHYSVAIARGVRLLLRLKVLSLCKYASRHAPRRSPAARRPRYDEDDDYKPQHAFVHRGSPRRTPPREAKMRSLMRSPSPAPLVQEATPIKRRGRPATRRTLPSTPPPPRSPTPIETIEADHIPLAMRQVLERMKIQEANKKAESHRSSRRHLPAAAPNGVHVDNDEMPHTAASLTPATASGQKTQALPSFSEFPSTSFKDLVEEVLVKEEEKKQQRSQRPPSNKLLLERYRVFQREVKTCCSLIKKRMDQFEHELKAKISAESQNDSRS